jgi:transposase-like protein
MSVLNAPHFHDEAAAYQLVEARVWPAGRVCPHCGVVDRSGALKGSSTRVGVYKCYECRKPFTVKVGTIFESSHIKLHIWLQAIFLICSSKKGISSNQLHRTLGITLKSAWFLSHRIREAMRDLAPGPIGGEGKTVQADETYFGTRDAFRGKPWAEKKGHTKKMSVVSLVSDGKARTFHVERADAPTIRSILIANIDPASELHTDQAYLYRKVGKEFANHETVHHDVGEYVGPTGATMNNVENYFSVFKRGMKGTYQHCSEKHLHRYLAEFDFRYNNRAALEVCDHVRAERAIKGVIGKRLKYQTSH